MNFRFWARLLIAEEGFNATVSGLPEDIEKFIGILEKTFETKIIYKTSFHAERPFLKAKVRIKQEIVSLRKRLKLKKESARTRNLLNGIELISDENTINFGRAQ